MVTLNERRERVKKRNNYSFFLFPIRVFCSRFLSRLIELSDILLEGRVRCFKTVHILLCKYALRFCGRCGKVDFCLVAKGGENRAVNSKIIFSRGHGNRRVFHRRSLYETSSLQPDEVVTVVIKGRTVTELTCHNNNYYDGCILNKRPSSRATVTAVIRIISL